ncbi:MAG: hypothetical protein ACHQAY_20160 [Hyphomicrobiales bacterium]
MALAFAAFLFNILVDPYGANPLRIRFERPLMDINQRFMYPQVLRSGEFDSAVFGTSTVRLLKPSDLEAEFGGRFANFGINAATPFEQSEAVSLYLSHMPALRLLVWGIDPSWCERDAGDSAKLLTERAFPAWLYRGSGWGVIPHLFNLRTLEIAGRVVANRLRLLKPRLPRDGYDVFTPPEASYDLSRARQHIWGGEPRPIVASEPAFQASEAERAAWSYPALDRLAATLANLPEGARLLALFPPVHLAFQPAPGSFEAASEAECKRRVAVIVASRKGLTVDLRFASPITREDMNYWDPLHYRLPIAKRVAEALGRAAEGEGGNEDFRVITPDR